MSEAAAYQGMILINALNLHKNTVHSLWRLSKQQNRLLKNKKYHKLFASKRDKETLLESLKKWSSEIRYYYETLGDWQTQLTEDERSHILALIEKISGLIENTLMVENENRALLEQRKKELIQELGTVDFYQDCLISVFENRN